MHRAVSQSPQAEKDISPTYCSNIFVNASAEHMQIKVQAKFKV